MVVIVATCMKECTHNRGVFTARIHVKQYVAGIANVMGKSEFDLAMTGAMGANKMTVTGSIPGAPGELHGILTKRGELPARVATA